jgi:hypothetical protein
MESHQSDQARVGLLVLDQVRKQWLLALKLFRQHASIVLIPIEGQIMLPFISMMNYCLEWPKNCVLFDALSAGIDGLYDPTNYNTACRWG